MHLFLLPLFIIISHLQGAALYQKMCLCYNQLVPCCLLQRLLLLMTRAAAHKVDEEAGTFHQDDNQFMLISNKMQSMYHVGAFPK